jgi:branched-chain amino acid transport system substrate-binding protein
MCSAVAPLVATGPVMYCLSPGIHPAKGSYVFTSSVSTHDLENALIRYFRLKGWTKIALITSTDASGQDAERGIDEVMKLPENKGMVMVERVHFNPTDVSVSAQIERVKAAGPQAFIAWSTGAPIATIFKGIIQAGLNVPVATTDGNMTYAQMKQYAAFMPKELYFPVGLWAAQNVGVKVPAEVKKAQDEFYAAYKAENASPDVASNHGWAPAMVLIDALRKLGPNATATQLRDYLGHLKNHPGINGMVDFESVPQRGLSVQNAVVTRWDAARQGWETMSQPTGIPLAK